MMDDPIQRHPTRAEQLDILATIVAAQTAQGDRLVDLGCGGGYVADLILAKRPDLQVTGVDVSAKALAEAAGNLAKYGDRWRSVEGDLMVASEIDLPRAYFRIVYSALTFHDLSDAAKQSVIAWAVEHMSDGGYFLLYDRLRLTEAELFPLQQTIWRRIERLHGDGMRTADSFEAYVDDFGNTNRPAALGDYFDWFASAGLSMAVLHLHGNVALIAGAKRR